MPISGLQRAALTSSQNFVEQVNGIVVKEALYKFEQTAEMSDSERNQLSQLVRTPQNYAFPQTIVCDAAWALTYDVWAADPPAQDGAIGAAVQKVWPLLVPS